jgi:hypothetical protein
MRRRDVICRSQTGKVVIGGHAPIINCTARDAARLELEQAVASYRVGDTAGGDKHLRAAQLADPELKTAATRNAGRKRKQDGGVDQQRLDLFTRNYSPEQIAAMPKPIGGCKVATVNSSISSAIARNQNRS